MINHFLVSKHAWNEYCVHRIMEEIEEVVGDKATVDADDTDKLTYMNQVW